MRFLVLEIVVFLFVFPALALELRAPVNFETPRVHKAKSWNIDLEGNSTRVAEKFNKEGLLISYGTAKKLDSIDAQIYSTSVLTRTAYGWSSRSESYLELPFFHLQLDVQENKENNKFNSKANEDSNNFYKPLQSESFSGLGDVKLGYKYVFFTDGANTVSFRGSITAPTGRAPQADELVSLSTGDGLWVAGAQMLWGFRVAQQVQWNLNGGMDFPMADEVEMRVPQKEGEALSSDSERLFRRTGTTLGLGSSLQYGSTTKGFSLGVGYNYQYQEPTRFSGSKFEVQRYQWLEDLHASQQLQSATSEVRYVLGEFSSPIGFAVGYTRILAGENVENRELVTAKTSLIF